MSELRPVIERFAPITLAEMDAVRLQDRVDTKYVIPAAGIPALLEHLSSWYRVLEVEGVRGINYRTLYLDTPDLRSYLDHHNGRVLRSKVRFREYVDSGICFLEVKRKTGRGRTDKVRMPVDRIITPMTPDQLAFVHRYQGDGAQTPLVPMLWNMFFDGQTMPHSSADLRASGGSWSFGSRTFNTLAAVPTRPSASLAVAMIA